MEEVIKDYRILKKFIKKYDMQFDKKYKYCICEGNFENDYNVGGYKLKYFSGCFYPYLVKNN